MTFEKHKTYELSKEVKRYIKRFETKIKPTLPTDVSQEIENLTLSILDHTNKIYSYLEREDSDLSSFYNIAREFNDNQRNRHGNYFENSEDPLKIDYIESGKHNSLYQLTLNKTSYGEKIANYLMGLSSSCTMLLDDQVAAQEHRRNTKIKFGEPSFSPGTISRERTLSLSDSSNDSREEKGGSAGL